MELAALDLGSNSFHLIIVRHRDGELRVVDRLNEYVRLAAGLDGSNRLKDDKSEQGLEALARIGQRLRHLPPENYRVVATNTLRKAKNAPEFVARAESVLGHSIEVISGKEEARLIYLGVSRNRASGRGRNLVIDIGGGSTELVIGDARGPSCMESLFMGCVSIADRFFPDGAITRSRMDDAVLSASIELLPIVENYRRVGWQLAIGSSGSVKSVLKVVREAGWCKNLITAKALAKLTRQLVSLGRADPTALPGLSEKRAPVFAGGVAVLNACFEQLGIEKMEVSDAALREGVIQDLIGRQHSDDPRHSSVASLARRYHVDDEQASRVEATALYLFDQVRSEWDLNGAVHRPLLRWAARLHEIGLDISHHQYHKHGAYVIANTDLTGFSMPERAMLATLVRGHRRKLSDFVFQSIPETTLASAERLVVLLRLAVTVHRHRSPEPSPTLRLGVAQKNLRLEFPAGWLERRPLTRTLFEEENRLIATRGFVLEIL